MRYLFALAHFFLLHVEKSSGEPCPFLMGESIPHDLDLVNRSMHNHHEVENDSLLLEVLEDRSLRSPKESGSNVLKGQSTTPIHTTHTEERDIRRKLRKKKKKKNSASRQKKKQKKKTNKRNKNSSKRGKNGNKRGKRGTGLGGSTSSRCFSSATYDQIDDDIAKLKKVIKSPETRSHFLGGIVRLAAHDFMDFDRRDRNNPMGADGCFDETHPNNKGLPESVWCKTCLLRRLYEERYSFLSRADFWIASANAVIRQTSENNELNLKDSFRWGRKDRSTCRHSASRLPEATGCKDVESTFLTRMGLEWKDAVALLGAHSLGRGSAEFSGHEGTWVDNSKDAQVFNKQYYEEIVFEAWRPRNIGQENSDWTTGIGRHPRLMLHTDICLVFNIDDNLLCCTKTDDVFENSQSACLDRTLEQCPLYSNRDSRWAATEAVVEYIGAKGSNDNKSFYSAFAEAWEKATTNGWGDLKVLSENCTAT